ncbi:L,D-transpeptidase family protein [Shimazuella sp. AN120528]|uniref:L,D-transpeptidase family protein n=1 Tax=Shimazuella soli TaxID=1892854 RepID=UPI001F10758E|nr:L,D-transpeptidase family protein [Shimazuella soli]MCH5585428.1 L,D-transpeptidase family protein [Shimazuella soli]
MQRLKGYVYFTFILTFAMLVGITLPTHTNAAPVSYKIEISKTTDKTPSKLYLYRNGKVIKVYPVATGANTAKIPAGSKVFPASATPEGTFPIVMKTVNPQWKNVPGTINGKPNPNNPLGVRWHGLNVNGDGGRYYGIHGTNNPSSIGKHVSHGCIRMFNKDVVELFNIVPLGTPVWIHTGPSTGVWKGDPNVGAKTSANSYTASFPGKQYFKKGASNKYVYQLGVMLQRVGKGKHYRVGPSNQFTEADRLNVQEYQLSQGFKGTKPGQDADGYPGPETWNRLVKQSKILEVNTTNN